jgi:hypothetical protein
VSYSEHSSFSEIVEFIRIFRCVLLPFCCVINDCFVLSFVCYV